MLSVILYIGIHIEEEAEEEEVDPSLRGRLLSLIEKIKSLRGKKAEEKPEVEEEIKPSKSHSKPINYMYIYINIHYILLSLHTFINLTLNLTVYILYLSVFASLRHPSGTDLPHHDPLGTGVIHSEP